MTEPSSWHCLSTVHKRQLLPGTHVGLEVHASQSVKVLQRGDPSGLLGVCCAAASAAKRMKAVRMRGGDAPLSRATTCCDVCDENWIFFLDSVAGDSYEFCMISMLNFGQTEFDSSHLFSVPGSSPLKLEAALSAASRKARSRPAASQLDCEVAALRRA